MNHENFPVDGFKFMNEPATDEQKTLILQLVDQLDLNVDHSGEWPEPFSRWDAYRTIQELRYALNEQTDEP